MRLQTWLTRFLARSAVFLLLTTALASAQSQNVGAVGRGVSISFQNASGSADRGVSVGFSSSLLGNISIQCNIPNATFTLIPSVPGAPKGGPFPVTLSNVPIGTYQVVFNAVPGYVTPVVSPLLVMANATTTFNGAYTVAGSGAGAIIVSTNQPGASFTVQSSSAAYTGSGIFSMTGPVEPPGSYTITFNQIHGYYTPSQQTLTLAPGGTIQFSGIYRRVIVTLFTGFGESPAVAGLNITYPGNVTYDFGYSPCNTVAEMGLGVSAETGLSCLPGMVNLATELQTAGFFKGSLFPQVFAFYNSSQEQNHCSAFSCDPQDYAPPDDSDDDVAQAWIDNAAKPSPDDVLVVIGHSYGGNRAKLFTEQLAKDGHSVAALITIDPIDWDLCSISPAPICDQSAIFSETKPANAFDVFSFAQHMLTLADLAGYHFWTNPSAPPFALLPYGVQTLSYSACDADINFCAHRFIAYDPNVHAQIVSFVQSLLTSPLQAISNVQASNVTANSVQISWNTLQPANGQVLFATDSTLTEFYVAGNDANGISNTHSASIAGLLPGQVYYYRVTSTPVGQTAALYSSVKEFVTLASGSPLVNASIVGFNDITDPSHPDVTLQLTNTGTATATGCEITRATIGTVVPVSPLPITVPNLAPGGSVLQNIAFPGPIGPSGSLTSVLISGDCSGRSFAAASRPRL
jgi:pimeloyl-ACP methyl ester carboxylesterase